MSQATIKRLYDAFAQLDAATMEACYAPQAKFDDEAFSLRGRAQIGGMWRMLCETTRTKGMAHWKLDVSDITDRSAHWEAHYLFGSTGRVVHNKIDAEFEFDDSGLITRQVDRFDFWAWSRQALGRPGLFLGWTPWLRAKVRVQAGSSLSKYMAAKGLPG